MLVLVLAGLSPMFVPNKVMPSGVWLQVDEFRDVRQGRSALRETHRVARTMPPLTAARPFRRAPSSLKVVRGVAKPRLPARRWLPSIRITTLSLGPPNLRNAANFTTPRPTTHPTRRDSRVGSTLRRVDYITSGEINRVRSADLVRRRVLDTVWDSSRWSKLQILFVWVFWFVDRLIRQGGCHQSCSMGWPPTQSLSAGRGTPPYPRPEPSGSSHQHHSVSSVQTRPSIFCSPNQSCRGLYLFCGAGYFRAP